MKYLTIYVNSYNAQYKLRVHKNNLTGINVYNHIIHFSISFDKLKKILSKKDKWNEQNKDAVDILWFKYFLTLDIHWMIWYVV